MCRIINSLLCLNNLISSINDTISIWNAHRYMHKKYSKVSAIDVCTKTNKIHLIFFQFQFDVAVRTSFVYILFCLFFFFVSTVHFDYFIWPFAIFFRFSFLVHDEIFLLFVFANQHDNLCTNTKKFFSLFVIYGTIFFYLTFAL